MGRITSLQNTITELQKTLAGKNKIIASTNARDAKIRVELEKTKDLNFTDHAKTVEEIRKLLG